MNRGHEMFEGKLEIKSVIQADKKIEVVVVLKAITDKETLANLERAIKGSIRFGLYAVT